MNRLKNRLKDRLKGRYRDQKRSPSSTNIPIYEPSTSQNINAACITDISQRNNPATHTDDSLIQTSIV
jgi:hypothetical protein